MTVPRHRVAVIGSGPAALYAVMHILEQGDPTIEIDVLERLATPWGLVRSGVAPDHPEKKLIIDRLFRHVLSSPRVRFFGNVDVGVDLPIEVLAGWYDATIVATGASGDREMGIPGEHLPGSWSAREFVGFYNGHPDHAGHCFDLSSRRAVIVGNGNVALDVARILTIDPARLACTDIADRALESLRHSAVREVVVLGRRGPDDAACHAPELEEFLELPDVDVLVDNGGATMASNPDWKTERKNDVLRRLADRPTESARRRIVFRFMTSPVALEGETGVERLIVQHTGTTEDQASQGSRHREAIDTRIVFRACGYRGTPFPGLPFDDELGIIPNVSGRVINGDGTVPRIYVTGWIKRGCRGVIGSNKSCAAATVTAVLDDLVRKHKNTCALGRGAVLSRLNRFLDRLVSYDGWSAIDRAEQTAGRARGRPRVKLVEKESLLHTAGI